MSIGRGTRVVLGRGPLALVIVAVVGACFLLLGRAARAQETQGLQVQRRWRVFGVAAATSVSAAPPASEVKRALEHSARTIQAQLGIEWEIAARVRHARYQDAVETGAKLELTDARFQALVEGLAEKDDALARADLVFVYVSAPEQPYAGYSELRAHPGGRAPVWYSVVNVTQGPRTARALLEQLEKRTKPLGLEPDESQRAKTEQALKLLASPLDRGPLQRLALWATTVHEFGHMLSPGTKDVRSVTDEAAFSEHVLKNGADDKEHHDPSCVMWTPDPASLLRKLERFPDVVHYCNGCRERLGLEPRR